MKSSTLCRLSSLLLVLMPMEAFAHASDRIFVVSLPTRYYYAAGAIAVLATFALMLALGPGLSVSPRKLFRLPARFPVALTRWLSFFGIAALVAVGFLGTRDPLENLLVLTIWTLLWVGLTLASVLFGDLWSALNPWIAPVRMVRSLIGRDRQGGLDRLGLWPAVAGFLAFAWFEIVSPAPDDPAILARAVLFYWLAIFFLAVHAGEAWLQKGEFLTVFFDLMARIAPVWPERRDGRTFLMLGLPATRLARLEALPWSGIAFVTLVLATLSFDGLADTFFWLAAIGVNPLEFPGRSAVVGVNTAGLFALWGMMTAAILLAIRAGANAAGFRNAAGRVILSFLPIAAGYHIAHYLVALRVNGQYAVQALADPFGRGQDLFGLGEHFVSTSFLGDYHSMLAIWNIQAFCIVAGHVIAVVLAFRLSGRLGDETANALASARWRDAPMTALMVFYTVFGLWLLSSPTGA